MLHFDIDDREIEHLQRDLGATTREVRYAFNRALRRTAATIKRVSTKDIKDELQLRSTKALRRRLKLKRYSRRSMSEVLLWYGLNDLPVSAFKGTPKKNAKGVAFRGEQFDGAFITKGASGYRTVFKRAGAARMPIKEQKLPIKDEMRVYVEDEIFDKVPEMFMRYFEQDLRARVIHGVGRKN